MNTRKFLVMLLGLIALLQATSADAAWMPLTVTNPEFETDLTGWTQVWGVISGWDSPNAPGSKGGSVYMGGSGVLQDLTATVAANTDYRITVADFNYGGGYALRQFGFYLGNYEFWTPYEAPLQGENTWADYSLTVTAAQISSASIGGRIAVVLYGAGWTYFDHIRVEANTVPEPATLAILGLGSLFLVRRK